MKTNEVAASSAIMLHTIIEMVEKKTRASGYNLAKVEMIQLPCRRGELIKVSKSSCLVKFKFSR